MIYFTLISIGTAFRSKIKRPPTRSAKAIRTAGSNAENLPFAGRLATSVALLVELKAQFYKLVTL